MIIKKLKLENIRSYQDSEILFPTGLVLLSGNIGSGKSTVLLAMDFALFGLRKSSLSGGSLLRNGAKKGSIELYFEVDGKEVIIRRTLKRGTSSISQDSGFISINGEKKDASALEISQHVIDLLKYPQEMLTKSKSQIFHYTVYTPQESMKQILLGDADMRLDTLRKVFGIDKYKRIKENTKILSSNLKSKGKELTGFILDLKSKQEKKQIEEKKLLPLNDELHELNLEIRSSQETIKQKEEELSEVEKKGKMLNELKKNLEINNINLNNKIEQKKKNKQEQELLEDQIGKLLEESKEEVKDLSKEINELEERIKTKEKELQENNFKINEFRTKANHSKEILSKIINLNECPTCKQEVCEEHKDSVKKEEEEKISLASKSIDEIKKDHDIISEELSKLKNELDNFKEQRSRFEVIRHKKESLNEKIKTKEKIIDLQAEIKKEIGRINVENSELFSKIDGLKDAEEIYNKTKSEVESVKEKAKNLEIRQATLQNEMKSIMQNIEFFETEIKGKLKARENLQKITGIQDWLENHFSNLMDVMEKRVMLIVHYDFNSLFQKWFSMLMDNDGITVNLDEVFTPVITQNGHEIDYKHLSGGEKTAAALAYRLALNQVINNLMETIKTNDLLILDEPTDGFSSEQIEKIQDVLRELNIKQIILVSHDPKVESFVDSVIRFEKENHVSNVIYS